MILVVRLDQARSSKSKVGGFMRPQELNLLVVFDAIMTEKSITRAAERLAMTQPAVSNAVSRMRGTWKDDLFVKDGRNIRPTLYAQNLWAQVREPLLRLSQAVQPDSFDPATSNRTFRVAVTDVITEMIWVPLRKMFEQQAPGINLHAIPYTIDNTEQVLEDAEVDLVIGASGLLSGTFRADYLFSSQYLCVMRPDHPLTHTKMTLKQFASADHLLVSLSGDTTGYTDQVLMQQGLTRRIAVTVNHFSMVKTMLVESDLICVIPAGVVSKAVISGELIAVMPPVEVIGQPVSALWHKRQDKDQGLMWLRQHIKQMLIEKVRENYMAIVEHMCPEYAEECAQKLNVSELRF